MPIAGWPELYNSLTSEVCKQCTRRKICSSIICNPPGDLISEVIVIAIKILLFLGAYFQSERRSWRRLRMVMQLLMPHFTRAGMSSLIMGCNDPRRAPWVFTMDDTRGTRQFLLPICHHVDSADDTRAPAYLADMFGTMHVGGIHGRRLTALSATDVLGPLAITSRRLDLSSLEPPKDTSCWINWRCS